MKFRLGITITLGMIGALSGGTAGYAFADCGPIINETAFCFIDNGAYALGNNSLAGGGGGLHLQPIIQLTRI